jgi:hypothetical protein
MPLIGELNLIQLVWRLWSRSGWNTIIGNTMLNQDFKEFIQLLNGNDVRDLVGRGYAKNKRSTGRNQDLADLENLE